MFRIELLFSPFCTDLATAGVTLCVGKGVPQNDASATVTSICQIMHQAANVTVASFLSLVSRREHIRAFTTTNHTFFSHFYLRRPILEAALRKDQVDRRPDPRLHKNPFAQYLSMSIVTTGVYATIASKCKTD
jgi:hypothetical protein